MQKLWLAALALVGGCVGAPLQEPETSDRPAFRTDGDADYQDFQLWKDSFGGTDIIDFEIQNGFVYLGDSREGDLLLNIHDGAIFDAANTTELCRYADATLGDTPTPEVLFHPDGKAVYDGVSGIQQPTYLLIDVVGNPEVLFSTDGKAVYDGLSGIQSFSFKKDEIYRGEKRSAELIAFASVNLTPVGPERKLLIAALYSGHCGAPVLQA